MTGGLLWAAPVWSALAYAALVLAALPAALAVVNLRALRTPPLGGAGSDDRVSILIPARNEAARIGPTLDAALATRGVAFEVIVADDGSTDGTDALVAARAAGDARLRLLRAPPLPPGWTGKMNACEALAAAAGGTHLLFLDADIHLAPDAAERLVGAMRAGGAGLVSGVPRQVMGTLGECLTVPAINLLLMGYLPIPLMRARPDPDLGAACGQLVLIERDAYRRGGGHGAVRATLHDGVTLPRAFRRAGVRTDLVAGHALARGRMYEGLAQAWAGFSKNANEGMATPRGLPLWTVLLLGGHVLPVGLALAWLAGAAVPGGPVLAALVLSFGARAAITLACREPVATIPLHPAAVLTGLALQWNALLRPRRAGVASWRGRAYSGGADPA